MSDPTRSHAVNAHVLQYLDSPSRFQYALAIGGAAPRPVRIEVIPWTVTHTSNRPRVPGKIPGSPFF